MACASCFLDVAHYCFLLKEIYFKLKSLLCLAIMFGLDIFGFLSYDCF